MILVEDKYMARCFALARCGAAHTSPNPMVGAVVVHDGRIIGEGYHRKYGEAHAEVNAIRSVRDRSLLKEATIYVSLEPCSHYGKTPPCSELIVREQIPRVVIGCLDPYPEVSGRGVRMLREAGVEVVTGVLEAEAKALNATFITRQTKDRPYVILKWAQSADGYIDRVRTDPSVPPVMLSSPYTLLRVHRLRSEASAIMVGTNTALLDNPSLTVRHWSGKSPLRVMIDQHLRIPPHYHLLDGSVRTLVFTGKAADDRPNVEYVRTDFSLPVLPQVLSCLNRNKVNLLMVEGGTNLLTQFLETSLCDEVRIETAPVLLGSGVKAPELLSAYNLRPIQQIPLEAGHMITVYYKSSRDITSLFNLGR